jgi:hypothetical protein
MFPHKLWYLFGESSILCLNSNICRYAKLSLELLTVVPRAVSRENISCIIERNVEVFLASKADDLQNLEVYNMK